ncbi:hypothetical protein [Hyphomonas sp.]|uniref:hypothetical protein n=1 Tax=Hyphomonas sp. TaxID=87 RepID=UPI0030F954CB
MRLIFLLLLIIGAGVASAQGIRLNPDDFGPAPVFNWTEAPPSPEGMMPAPPQLTACISNDERNRALRTVKSDCSCSAYAEALEQKPWDRARDLVCGFDWYACWAPVRSDQAVRERFLSGFAAYSPEDMALMKDALLEQVSDAGALNEIRKGQVMEDALAWDTARVCD